jgi:hypothetical protein
MKKLKIVLDIIAFIFTIFLVVYGFSKGYDLIELSIYNIYFVVIITTQIISLSEK